MTQIFGNNLNVLLSELFNQMGVISYAKQIGSGRSDIVVYYQGLDVVLEGFYSRSDAEQGV